MRLSLFFLPVVTTRDRRASGSFIQSLSFLFDSILFSNMQEDGGRMMGGGGRQRGSPLGTIHRLLYGAL